jgi:cadherin 5 type 2 (VE-cadherin)
VVEPYNPFSKRNQVAEFEIGSNKSCPLEIKGYCNGPLRSGRNYHIKIRAFTDDDKFSDTGFKIMSTDQDNSWLIVALAVPFSLFLVFIVCFLYLRRNCRRKDPFCNKRPKPIQHEPTSLSESIVDTT